MVKKTDPYSGIKAGAFTAQAKRAGMTLPKYADYVIKNYKDKKSKFNPSLTTFRRAMFYRNLVLKK